MAYMQGLIGTVAHNAGVVIALQYPYLRRRRNIRPRSNRPLRLARFGLRAVITVVATVEAAHYILPVLFGYDP